MIKLSIYDKYSIDEIAKELNLSKRVSNGIKNHFGESLSLFELSQIRWSDFIMCKGLGLKSWREFSSAISLLGMPEKAVKIIDRPTKDKLIVEIDISKSFSEVISQLSNIIKNPL
jgi:hypothetical protein